MVLKLRIVYKKYQRPYDLRQNCGGDIEKWARRRSNADDVVDLYFLELLTEGLPLVLEDVSEDGVEGVHECGFEFVQLYADEGVVAAYQSVLDILNLLLLVLWSWNLYYLLKNDGEIFDFRKPEKAFGALEVEHFDSSLDDVRKLA